MKRIWQQPAKRHGFTIIELLTVMSIIVILISLLTPALNRVRRYAMDVKQRAQFHSIGVALDLFNAENEGYPRFQCVEDQRTPTDYCGAMKLAEAMVGQDLKGFNPKSRFDRMVSDQRCNFLYRNAVSAKSQVLALRLTLLYIENIKSRKMYLELENANAYQT